MQLSVSLRVTRYPYVGLIAHSGVRAKLVMWATGAVGPQQLLEQLEAALEHHGAEMVADRADAEERVLPPRPASPPA